MKKLLLLANLVILLAACGPQPAAVPPTQPPPPAAATRTSPPPTATATSEPTATVEPEVAVPELSAEIADYIQNSSSDPETVALLQSAEVVFDEEMGAYTMQVDSEEYGTIKLGRYENGGWITYFNAGFSDEQILAMVEAGGPSVDKLISNEYQGGGMGIFLRITPVGFEFSGEGPAQMVFLFGGNALIGATVSVGRIRGRTNDSENMEINFETNPSTAEILTFWIRLINDDRRNYGVTARLNSEVTCGFMTVEGAAEICRRSGVRDGLAAFTEEIESFLPGAVVADGVVPDPDSIPWLPEDVYGELNTQ